MKSEQAILISILTIIAGLFAMPITGVVSDLVGRRPLIVASFSLIGIALGMLALSPFSPNLILFYLGICGLAWGCLTVLFVLVIWGDVALGFRSDLYYTLGLFVYFFSASIARHIGLLLPSFLDLGGIYLVSSAALFLMIPVIYASPETLPPEARDRIWLEWYARQARRIRERRAGLS